MVKMNNKIISKNLAGAGGVCEALQLAARKQESPVAAWPIPGESIQLQANKQVFKFMLTEPSDIDAILKMVHSANGTGALIEKGLPEELQAWVKEGMSFVVKHPETGKAIAHMAIDAWTGCLELRTVVTHEDFRKQGINGSLTHMVLDLIFAKWPDAVVVEVKNDASMGEALLKNAIGFTEISIGEIESLGVNVKELDQTWHFYKLTKAQYMAGPLNSSKRD